MPRVMASVREAVLSQSKLSQDISLVPCSSLISHHCQVLTPCATILSGSLGCVCLEDFVLLSTSLLIAVFYDLHETQKKYNNRSAIIFIA